MNLSTITRHTLSAALVVALSCISLVSSAKEIKIATVSPDGSSWMKTMRQAGKDIENATSGRVKFKFYPGGVMGSDKAVLRKIRVGQLHGGAFPGGSLLSYYPDSQIYNLPLKFRSFEEIDYIRAKMDQRIIDGLEKGGFVTFGLGEAGLAYLMSNNPVYSVEDLRQQKVWIPNDDPTSLHAVKAFGVSPIPLGLSDVLASLQTGLVNTVTISPIGAIALQWHTQVKYMTDLPLLYIYALLAVDKKVFDKLAEADQKVVRKIMGEAFLQIDKQNRADNISAFDALTQQGIELIKPDQQQIATWQQTAQIATDKLLSSGQISRESLDLMEQLLNEYRSKHNSADAK